MIMKRALTILSVSILGAAWLCGCGKIRENRKQGRRRLIPCLLFRTIRDVRPKVQKAVEWYQDTV